MSRDGNCIFAQGRIWPSVEVVAAPQPGRELRLKPGLQVDLTDSGICTLAKVRAASQVPAVVVPLTSKWEDGSQIRVGAASQVGAAMP